jgi:hypothetical protein
VYCNRRIQNEVDDSKNLPHPDTFVFFCNSQSIYTGHQPLVSEYGITIYLTTSGRGVTKVFIGQPDEMVMAGWHIGIQFLFPEERTDVRSSAHLSISFVLL